MTHTPPPLKNQANTDEEHLRLLGIFHYVAAGLSLLGIGFLYAHYLFMKSIFEHPEIWDGENSSGPPPQEFFGFFLIIYVSIGLFAVASFIGNLLVGIFMKRRKHRMLTLVIAGINCLQMPLGTALGVFTFIVLLRPSVVETYEKNA